MRESAVLEPPMPRRRNPPRETPIWDLDFSSEGFADAFEDFLEANPGVTRGALVEWLQRAAWYTDKRGVRREPKPQTIYNWMGGRTRGPQRSGQIVRMAEVLRVPPSRLSK